MPPTYYIVAALLFIVWCGANLWIEKQVTICDFFFGIALGVLWPLCLVYCVLIGAGILLTEAGKLLAKLFPHGWQTPILWRK